MQAENSTEEKRQFDNMRLHFPMTGQINPVSPAAGGSEGLH
jgi:hypothetical protein